MPCGAQNQHASLVVELPQPFQASCHVLFDSPNTAVRPQLGALSVTEARAAEHDDFPIQKQRAKLKSQIICLNIPDM